MARVSLHIDYHRSGRGFFVGPLLGGLMVRAIRELFTVVAEGIFCAVARHVGSFALDGVSPIRS